MPFPLVVDSSQPAVISAELSYDCVNFITESKCDGSRRRISLLFLQQCGRQFMPGWL